MAMDFENAMAFQSTLPVWGATSVDVKRGADVLFQSTLPVWGATGEWIVIATDAEFQSTLPVWGATAENHNKYTIF